MALGEFVAPPSTGKSSQFKPQENVGRPIIAVAREFIADFTSPQYPDPKDVVIYDVVTLDNGNILPNVITGSGAMVTRLKRFIPGGEANQTPNFVGIPVKIIRVSRPAKQDYYSIEGLKDFAELELANAWDAQFGMPAIDAARQAAEAAAMSQPPSWQNQGQSQQAPPQQWQPQGSPVNGFQNQQQAPPQQWQPQGQQQAPQWQNRAPAAQQPAAPQQWQPQGQQQAPAPQQYQVPQNQQASVPNPYPNEAALVEAIAGLKT